MTAVRALLVDFERAGGTVTIEAGTVRVKYPETHKQAVAPILARLREHRAEVTRLLRERSTKSVPAPRSIQREPIRARIIGQNRTAETDKAEECWHCGASGRCRCAVCCGVDKRGRTIPGECQSCQGAGNLAYETVQ